MVRVSVMLDGIEVARWSRLGLPFTSQSSFAMVRLQLNWATEQLIVTRPMMGTFQRNCVYYQYKMHYYSDFG